MSIFNLAVARPALAGCVLLAVAAAGQEPVKETPEPVLVIESFRAARAYAAGMDPFTLVGTIRNVGKGPLTADSARARMVTLAGLEYVSGDTLPKLPELAPGAAATFRWQVSPSRAEGPLVASLVVQLREEAPIVRVFAVPRLDAERITESASVARTPSASSGSGISVVENDRIRARLLSDISRDPVLLLSVRTAGGWRQVGAAVPLVEVEAAEPGQNRWWEQLNVEEVRTSSGPNEASLTLTGRVGLKWKGALELTIRAGSSVLDGHLRLTALRTVIPSGLRFLPLLAGEGSFGAAVTEALEPSSGGPAIHQAVRWGEITVGTVRRAELPVNGWQAGNMPNVESADFRLLGTEWRAVDTPSRVEPGGSIRLRGRVFALYPSAGVRNAFSVGAPEPLGANRPHRARQPITSPRSWRRK